MLCSERWSLPLGAMVCSVEGLRERTRQGDLLPDTSLIPEIIVADVADLEWET